MTTCMFLSFNNFFLYVFWVLIKTVRNKKRFFFYFLKALRTANLYHFGTKIVYDNEFKIHIVELI